MDALAGALAAPPGQLSWDDGTPPLKRPNTAEAFSTRMPYWNSAVMAQGADEDRRFYLWRLGVLGHVFPEHLAPIFHSEYLDDDRAPLRNDLVTFLRQTAMRRRVGIKVEKSFSMPIMHSGVLGDDDAVFLPLLNSASAAAKRTYSNNDADITPSDINKQRNASTSSTLGIPVDPVTYPILVSFSMQTYYTVKDGPVLSLDDIRDVPEADVRAWANGGAPNYRLLTAKTDFVHRFVERAMRDRFEDPAAQPDDQGRDEQTLPSILPVIAAILEATVAAYRVVFGMAPNSLPPAAQFPGYDQQLVYNYLCSQFYDTVVGGTRAARGMAGMLHAADIMELLRSMLPNPERVGAASEMRFGYWLGRISYTNINDTQPTHRERYGRLRVLNTELFDALGAAVFPGPPEAFRKIYKKLTGATKLEPWGPAEESYRIVYQAAAAAAPPVAALTDIQKRLLRSRKLRAEKAEKAKSLKRSAANDAPSPPMARQRPDEDVPAPVAAAPAPVNLFLNGVLDSVERTLRQQMDIVRDYNGPGGADPVTRVKIDNVARLLRQLQTLTVGEREAVGAPEAWYGPIYEPPALREEAPAPAPAEALGPILPEDKTRWYILEPAAQRSLEAALAFLRERYPDYTLTPAEITDIQKRVEIRNGIDEVEAAVADDLPEDFGGGDVVPQPLPGRLPQPDDESEDPAEVIRRFLGDDYVEGGLDDDGGDELPTDSGESQALPLL